MASELPVWLQYVQALGPTTVAVVAACIAGAIQWRMWKTANHKLKLDLFEKRYDAFDAICKLTVYSLAESEERFNLDARAAKAHFFFGADAIQLVIEIQRYSWQYKGIRGNIMYLSRSKWN